MDTASTDSDSVCTDSGLSDICSPQELSNDTDFEARLFHYLSNNNQKMSVSTFKKMLDATGLRESDPRLKECMAKLNDAQKSLVDCFESYDIDIAIDKETFSECIKGNIELITRAFSDQFVITEFSEFNLEINALYNKAKYNTNGKVVSYIPQLYRYSPDLWGVSVCTVDGQRHSIGDTTLPFCLQSVSKPLIYALAMEEHGPNFVHQYVGVEPSGRTFNEIHLNEKHNPHNPMINPGAMVTTSLLKPDSKIADRYEYCRKVFGRLAGGEYLGFNNSVFLSERQTADRNFAIGYYLKENNCFPKGTDLMEVLEFYFMQCSLEVNCDSLSLIAATLANGGVCPTTGDRVLSSNVVRNTLSLMHSCGMANYSGHFSFQVGLPAKAGVSGGIMLVVPNVMGIGLWSPPLDEYGNSCRGIQFCQDFVAKFCFHTFDKVDPPNKIGDYKRTNGEPLAHDIASLLFGASIGDLTCVKRYVLLEFDIEACDYYGRTAMHVAAAEGQMNIVKYLLEQCEVSPDKKDRWGCTPLDDARRFGHGKIANILEIHYEKHGKNESTKPNKSRLVPIEETKSGQTDKKDPMYIEKDTFGQIVKTKLMSIQEEKNKPRPKRSEQRSVKHKAYVKRDKNHQTVNSKR